MKRRSLATTLALLALALTAAAQEQPKTAPADLPAWASEFKSIAEGRTLRLTAMERGHQDVVTAHFEGTVDGLRVAIRALSIPEPDVDVASLVIRVTAGDTLALEAAVEGEIGLRSVSKEKQIAALKHRQGYLAALRVVRDKTPARVLRIREFVIQSNAIRISGSAMEPEAVHDFARMLQVNSNGLLRELEVSVTRVEVEKDGRPTPEYSFEFKGVLAPEKVDVDTLREMAGQ